MCVRLIDAFLICLIPSSENLFLILHLDITSDSFLLQLYLTFCFSFTMSTVLGLICFSLDFYIPMFFLPVARLMVCTCYRDEVAAPSLALLDPWTKVNVQRMEILRKLETSRLSFWLCTSNL